MATSTTPPAAPNRTLAPVRLATAVDEVVDRLLTALALGEFVPGQRLPAERELARLLKVSRTTVSEALRRLRDTGAVEVRRGRSGGSFVQESWHSLSAAAVGRTLLPRRSELRDLSDVRCRWEEVVARTAAERRTPEQARALAAALHGFATARTAEEEHAADNAIHAAVLAATGNEQMAALSHELLARVAVGAAIEPYDRGLYSRALAEHTALVEAVVHGRIEDAGRLARAHFTMSAQTLDAVTARGTTDGDVRLGAVIP